jgi:hypothetical protein
MDSSLLRRIVRVCGQATTHAGNGSIAPKIKIGGGTADENQNKFLLSQDNQSGGCVADRHSCFKAGSE